MAFSTNGHRSHVASEIIVPKSSFQAGDAGVCTIQKTLCHPGRCAFLSMHFDFWHRTEKSWSHDDGDSHQHRKSSLST